MITQKQIDETVTWEGLKEFGQFVLSHCEDGGLPDYKKMDLVDAPQLVPHIWVYDLRDDPSGNDLLVNFCGEEHVNAFGRNLMGEYASVLYDGDAANEHTVKFYRDSVQEKHATYTRRYQRLPPNDGNTRWKHIEALFFPCSSNGVDVNWGIGCTKFGMTKHEEENIFLHF